MALKSTYTADETYDSFILGWVPEQASINMELNTNQQRHAAGLEGHVRSNNLQGRTLTSTSCV